MKNQIFLCLWQCEGMDNLDPLFNELHAANRTKCPLRMAVVTETYPPEINGVAMTIGRLVGGLQRRDHQIQLIRPRQNSADIPVSGCNREEVLTVGVPIPRYDSLKLGLPAKRTLVRLWLSKRPDVVHIVTEGPLGWSALSAARKLKIPVCTDFHTNFHSYSSHYGFGWLKKPIAAYLRILHNQAGCTLVPTEQLRQTLVQHGYVGLRVVARGVDTELFSPTRRSPELRARWGAGPDTPVAIYVGRLAPEKNIPLVTQTFEAMRQINPSARLVLVGDGPARCGLQQQFPEHVFAGMKVGEDLAAHYASGDVFLFPSLTETYGNVTMEAMASGLAVVAYDYAAARQHIQHGVNGLLAPFNNVGAFVHQATALMTGSERIAALGKKARSTAEQLSWEAVVAAFEQVLTERAGRYQAGVDDG